MKTCCLPCCAFPEGVIGALEINWLTPTKVREVLVLGERGMFRVDDLIQDLYFYENAQAGASSPAQNCRKRCEHSRASAKAAW